MKKIKIKIKPTSTTVSTCGVVDPEGRIERYERCELILENEVGERFYFFATYRGSAGAGDADRRDG